MLTFLLIYISEYHILGYDIITECAQNIAYE